MPHVSYAYPSPSLLKHQENGDELFFAKYNEVDRRDVPCFFWGRLQQPFITTRCLLALSHVVQSSFALSPQDFKNMKDPVVTAGNGKLRFEGFSRCAGVYARVDVLPDGYDGEFLANGTTNVDFNDTMLSALRTTRHDERLMMSVGTNEVGLYNARQRIIERKVPLPDKWIKGLATVQIYQSAAVRVHRFNRLQTMMLFQTLPKGQIRDNYYLTIQGNRPAFTPMASKDAVSIGGAHRLHLLDALVPFVDELHVFVHPRQQMTVWQFYFQGQRFSLSLSRDARRGFSGEGAALDALLDDVPAAWVEAMDNYSFVNQQFNPTLFAIEHGIDPKLAASLTTRLAAMGLLGYDLDDNGFFYRRLPFKLQRIMKLNPRLENAHKLVEDGCVQLLSQTADRVESLVAGSMGITYSVVLTPNRCRCTCQWAQENQGERGVCKHILATKILAQWKKNS